MDKSFFDSFRTGDYQRANFDSFLEHIKFSYNVPSIHVTGTNGKGSTCTYIASIYEANGYKVGLFKSPYLFDPNEMISINGKNITDEQFLSIFNRFEKDISKFNLSAFEVHTFIGLMFFKEQACDIAVIECGMGGLIDATNIFTPVLSIITSVALEHTDALGYSISEIAFQKAGIIKEEVPVLINDLPEEATRVILNVAKENKSKVYYLGHYVNKAFHEDGYSFDYGEFYNSKISSLADYSVNDAVMALEAVTVLKDKFSIDADKTKQGLLKVKMECRMDVLKENPLVIVDGAHNPEAMAMLCEKSIHQVTQGKPIHVIFACFRDKNLGNMLASLGAITDDLSITTFDNPRARTEDEYFLFAADYPFRENAKELIKEKMEQYPDDVILITGSLAFAAYVKSMFIKGEL